MVSSIAARVSRTMFASGMITSREVGMIQYLGWVQSGSTLIHFKAEAKIKILNRPSTKIGMETTVVNTVETVWSNQDLAQNADATPSGIPSSATMAKEYVTSRTV